MAHQRCGAPAAVHCAADAAFLCDAKVHAANFLASRHRADGHESATSSCVSTADSASTTPAPAVLEGWAERMGVPAASSRWRPRCGGRWRRKEEEASAGATPSAGWRPARTCRRGSSWRSRRLWRAPHESGGGPVWATRRKAGTNAPGPAPNPTQRVLEDLVSSSFC
jgi:hypothetical protein